MNEIEKDFKSRGTITKKFTLPLLMWEEWEKDCKDNFNNTYSLKMQHDHEYRKNMSHITELIMQDLLELKQEVFELKAELASLSEQPDEEKEEKKAKTFG